MITKVSVENGKYTFIVEDGIISCLRFDKPWIGAGEFFLGAKAIMALIFELEQARIDLENLTRNS